MGSPQQVSDVVPQVHMVQFGQVALHLASASHGSAYAHGNGRLMLQLAITVLAAASCGETSNSVAPAITTSAATSSFLVTVAPPPAKVDLNDSFAYSTPPPQIVKRPPLRRWGPVVNHDSDPRDIVATAASVIDPRESCANLVDVSGLEVGSAAVLRVARRVPECWRPVVARAPK